jgi:hypothetical protein
LAQPKPTPRQGLREIHRKRNCLTVHGVRPAHHPKTRKAL